MTVGGYGSMRATDADRDQVHGLLQAAYADGRLTWDEFDSRSSSLLAAKTYDELAAISADLRPPVLYQPRPYPPVPAGPRPTNQLAIVSLAFGVGQAFLWGIGTIVAIVCGHMAKNQIRRTGEQGDGLATAGLVLGYVGLVIPLLAVALLMLVGMR